MSTKIDWTDDVWNPAWGCLNDCPYCYARKFARRFAIQVVETKNYSDVGWSQNREQYELLKKFKPVWIESNFQKKFTKKPQRIFVNSMSGIAFWRAQWMVKVLHKIDLYPLHTFQFLTKRPETYLEYNFSPNCWLGITITRTDQFKEVPWALWGNENLKFVSLEPLQERITELRYLNDYKWVIIGAETGNRKGKIKVKPKWISEILSYCARNKIPVFMKNNLRDIWSDLIQEFPK